MSVDISKDHTRARKERRIERLCIEAAANEIITLEYQQALSSDDPAVMSQWAMTYGLPLICAAKYADRRMQL